MDENIEQQQSEEIKIKDLSPFFKENKGVLWVLGVILVSLLGFLVRIRSVPNFKNAYLMALDPYPYLRYANNIVSSSFIPAIDTMRYFPLGLSTEGLLNLHSYFNANLFYLANIFGNFEMITIFIWYPAIAAALGFVAFYLMAKEIFNDRRIAILSSAFLAFTPGFLFRSVVGYADKEPLSIILFPLIIYFFIKALKVEDKKKSNVFALLSGFSMAALMSNWGGNIFLLGSMGTMFFLYAILNKTDKNFLRVSTIWLIFLPLATIANHLKDPTFYLQNTFSTFLIFGFAVMLVSFYLKPKISKYKPKFLPEGLFNVLVVSLLLLSLALIIMPSTVIGNITAIFSTVSDPFGGSRFTSSVSEFQQPYFLPDWVNSFGYSIYFFLFGVIMLFHEIVRKFKFRLRATVMFAVAFLFLIFSNFSRRAFPQLQNVFGSLYLPLFGLFLAYLFYLYFRNWEHVEENKDSVKFGLSLLLIWVLITVIGARGAIRIIWALIMPASMIIAFTFVKSSEIIGNYIEKSEIKDTLYKNIPYVIALIILILGGLNMSAAVFGAPLEEQWDQVTPWINENIAGDAVFTHWWDYGYWVQSIWGRTTVFDGGNYRSDWNMINARYIMTGLNKTQWMSGLNYFHRPDYMVIIDDDVGKFFQMARIGERDYAPDKSVFLSTFGQARLVDNPNITESEAFPKLAIFNPTGNPGLIVEDMTFKGVLWPKESIFVQNILSPTINDNYQEPIASIINVRTGETRDARYNCFCEKGVGCTDIRTDGIPACFMWMQPVDYGSVQSPFGVMHIPKIVEPMLFNKLYIVEEPMPEFELVFDNGIPLSVTSIGHGGITNIKIWKINYDAFSDYVLEPCDIETDCVEYPEVRELLG